MEDIILTHNLDVFKKNIEALRKNEPFDPEKFNKYLENFRSIQDVRKICSEYLKDKTRIQTSADSVQTSSPSWPANRWFLFLAVTLIAVWFISMFYAIRKLHRTAAILLLALLICWLVLGPGTVMIGYLFHDCGIASEQPITTIPVTDSTVV